MGTARRRKNQQLASGFDAATASTTFLDTPDVPPSSRRRPQAAAQRSLAATLAAALAAAIVAGLLLRSLLHRH